MVCIGNGKTTCFGLWRPSSDFDNFLAKRVLYNMAKPRGDVEISTFYVISLKLSLYDTLLARKLSKPEDGRYRPKHVVFPLLINIII